MFDLLENNHEALEGVQIEKRAAIPGGLPEELSIKDIAKLIYLDDAEKQEALIKVVVGACKDGGLQYYGKLENWSYRTDKPNPYPKIEGECMGLFAGDEYLILYAYPHDCLIHKDEFKAYLQSMGKWPLKDCLLSNWWQDDASCQTDKAKISKTERQTMLKLILGMAIDAYGYNPAEEKNTATGGKNGIAARLKDKGIEVNDDTVRKYLNEAKSLKSLKPPK